MGLTLPVDTEATDMGNSVSLMGAGGSGLDCNAFWGKPRKRKEPLRDPELGLSVLKTVLGKQCSLAVKR